MVELRYLSPEGWAGVTSDRDPARAAERARWVAEMQDGPISRQQLTACGFSSSKIGRLADEGWLPRLYPGTYALGQRALAQRGKLVAPLLYAGEGSAICHDTAGALRTLIARELYPIHISCTEKRRAPAGVIFHRPRSFDAEVFRGLPVTTLPQTLVDIASRCQDWELRKALANADFGGKLTPASLAAVMGKGLPGSAPLRVAILAHMPELAETLSPLEDMLLLLCEKHGVPLPTPNQRVGRFTPDGVWPEAMLIVELDGGRNHSSPSQRRRDAERDMYFRRLGYQVLRYTYWQVSRQGFAIATELRATLKQRSSLLR